MNECRMVCLIMCSVIVAGPSTSRSATSTGNGNSDVLTLVPSEGDSGELSYVLIVEGEGQDGASGSKDDKDTDLGIYDFDEAEQEADNTQVCGGYTEYNDKKL